MRILMVNHFPLEGSGSGTYTKNLACQLVALGHEVCVILPENDADFPRYDGVRMRPVLFTPDGGSAPAGALPFNFPCFTTHPRSATTFESLSAGQMDAYTGAFRAAIEDEVRTFRPDVVHGQHMWVLPALAAGLGVPLVLTAHGTDLMGYDRWPAMRPWADAAADAARAIICISRDNIALVERTWPQHAGKALLMRNGYNPAVFAPRQLDRAAELARYGVPYAGERLVLFAGKLTHFKAVDVLLDAAARYTEADVPTLTVVAGDGEERAALLAQKERLGLTSVHFIGNVAQDALARLYNVADVDLVPSRNEAFGLVAVEAMACGTPVVAANAGGLPDFVNEGVGALCVPEDPDDLARCILETLERAGARPAWREDIARYALQNYSQAAIMDELLNVYSTALL